MNLVRLPVIPVAVAPGKRRAGGGLTWWSTLVAVETIKLLFLPA
jgi:hypothetical protein